MMSRIPLVHIAKINMTAKKPYIQMSKPERLIVDWVNDLTAYYRDGKRLPISRKKSK